METQGNLFANVPPNQPDEVFQLLWSTPHFRLERIVSRGHATPPGQWYDQNVDEWVVLLKGSAGLRIDGRPEVVELTPGDFLLLPAGVKHRVEWTELGAETVWLAIHLRQAANG